MINEPKALESWRRQKQAKWSVPHPEIREERNGKIFTLTLGKICPWCREVFFTYQVEGEEREPYLVDKEIELYTNGTPVNNPGSRETCGYPPCHELEDMHQFRRRVAARAKDNGHKPKSVPKPEEEEL
jgi:hypothetical protein